MLLPAREPKSYPRERFRRRIHADRHVSSAKPALCPGFSIAQIAWSIAILERVNWLPLKPVTTERQPILFRSFGVVFPALR
jgi:hypothetical protein